MGVVVLAKAEKGMLDLKKHVGLIHSSNKLSLLERKIANALLCNAYDTLESQNEHQIHIRFLCELIGYNSRDTETVKRSLKSLMLTVIEWDIIDQNRPGSSKAWVASTMLAGAKIEGPLCTYSYSTQIRELCHRPEIYGRLNMKILSEFKSTYGLALYENCTRYQGIPQTPWFDMLTYRKLMGIPIDKYLVFRDLNRRVIKSSVKEVNMRAAIFVEPEFKRTGRAVTAIRFKISRIGGNVISAEGVPYAGSSTRRLGDRLREDYGFSGSQVESIKAKHEEAYVLSKMSLVESSATYKGGEIHNLARYLEKALEGDYQAPKSSRENVMKEKLTQEKEVKRVKKKKQQYERYLPAKTLDLIGELSVDKKTKVNKEFELHIESTTYHSLYIKEGFSSPLVQDSLYSFIKKKYPEILDEIPSFKEFLKKGGAV